MTPENPTGRARRRAKRRAKKALNETVSDKDPAQTDNDVPLQDGASRGESITDDSHSISPPSAGTATVSPYVDNQGVPDPVTRVSGEDGSPSTLFSGSTQQPHGLGASRWAIAGDPVDSISHLTSTGPGKHHYNALDLSMWAPRARSGARSADHISGPPTVDGPKSDNVVGSGVHPCPRG